MSKRPFPPELRTASVVPRWSIVWTLTRDVLTNHSFYATFYAREIAKLIRWRGDFGHLMFYALVHDLDETITGDIVSPVKKEIIDGTRAAQYIDLKMRERLPNVKADLDRIARYDSQFSEIVQIVKAADKLDALLFLIVEQRLGNGVIAPRIPSALANLEATWQQLPDSSENLHILWSSVIVPAIREHEETGGFGI